MWNGIINAEFGIQNSEYPHPVIARSVAERSDAAIYKYGDNCLIGDLWIVANGW